MAANTYTLECACGGFVAVVVGSLEDAWQRGKAHAEAKHPAFCIQAVRVKRGA